MHLSIIFDSLPLVRIHTITATTTHLVGRNISPHPRVVIPLISVATRRIRAHRIVRRIVTRISTRRNIRLGVPINAVLRLPHTYVITSRVTRRTSFFYFNAGSLARAAFNFSHSSTRTGFVPLCVRGGVLGSGPFRAVSSTMLRLIHVTIRGNHTAGPSVRFNIYNRRNNSPGSVGNLFGITSISCISYSPCHMPLTHLTTTRTGLRTGHSTWHFKCEHLT